MPPEIGSYLIYGFTQKIRKNIGKYQHKTLDIHDKGKQQTMNIFNNNKQR